jgi:hypothetical protein
VGLITSGTTRKSCRVVGGGLSQLSAARPDGGPGLELCPSSRPCLMIVLKPPHSLEQDLLPLGMHVWTVMLPQSIARLAAHALLQCCSLLRAAISHAHNPGSQQLPYLHCTAATHLHQLLAQVAAEGLVLRRPSLARAVLHHLLC